MAKQVGQSKPFTSASGEKLMGIPKETLHAVGSSVSNSFNQLDNLTKSDIAELDISQDNLNWSDMVVVEDVSSDEVSLPLGTAPS